MKLLFVINQFYKGGAETSLLNLLKQLDRSKYEIDLLIMNQVPAEHAISLVPQIPNHIHIFDAWKENRHLSPLEYINGKIMLTQQERFNDPISALLFVRNREYDWAFHVGEWWFPTFVATKVRAKQKAAWIHSDLSKANYFCADAYFSYYNCFQYYIFVSQNSMRSSIKKYPFLTSKACCIYNIFDTNAIRMGGKETITEPYFEKGIPVILTCANIRAEKNHLRQLEAMHILKKRDIDFIWLNIGSTNDKERCNVLLTTAKELGLENRFLLLGARENPFCYMTHADAIAVLSDHESWSMVITEAKILGIPVIATKTSGALEQIEDRHSGLLTDFNATDIANKIEEFLKIPELRQNIRNNIKNFDSTKSILDSFDLFVNQAPTEKIVPAKESLLYIIDDINYMGGAHIATKLQIQGLLKEGRNITVFSSTVPSAEIRSELEGATFKGWPDFKEDQLFNRRLLDCLTDHSLSKEDKEYKFRLTWEGKIRKNFELFDEMVFPHLSKLFSQYDVVCVMSEGSVFRTAVAASTCRRKVQWIHIDYCEWKNKTAWSRKITANDGKLYQNFDQIVVLSSSIRESFIQLYPHLAPKVVINRNMIPVDTILKKAQKDNQKENTIHFVTVGRVDYQKAYDRLLNVLQELYNHEYRFRWTIIGGGDEYSRIQESIARSELSGWVKMTGPLSNPFPLIKEADVFALLSQFEGLPNTIFEALILGVPVIATDVGGVATQIENGVNGWIVDNDETSIYEGIKHVLTHPEEIVRYRENLKSYHYNNEEVLNKAEAILFDP